MKRKMAIKKIGVGLATIAVAGMIAGAFLATRSQPISALEHTVYPGKRVTQSGGYDLSNLLSGSLDYQLQFGSKANYYKPAGSVSNQSESANFILLLPFLFLPSSYILWSDRKRKKRLDWPLALVNISFLIILVRLFVPYLSPVYKILLLDKVPHQRLLIGIGLLSMIQATLFIRRVDREKIPIGKYAIALYSILVFICEFLIGLHIKHTSPGFLGNYRLLAFSLPVPIIVYLLLRRKIQAAVLIFATFSVLTSILVNPLYRGLDILTNSPVQTQIQKLGNTDPDGRWVAEGLLWENFPQMNGALSLSGVYSYPQTKLWQLINASSSDIYNRYAHVEFYISSWSSQDSSTTLSLEGQDHFRVSTSACSQFLRDSGVKYVLSEQLSSGSASCAKLLSTVKYPERTFYIYRVN